MRDHRTALYVLPSVQPRKLHPPTPTATTEFDYAAFIRLHNRQMSLALMEAHRDIRAIVRRYMAKGA